MIAHLWKLCDTGSRSDLSSLVTMREDGKEAERVVWFALRNTFFLYDLLRAVSLLYIIKTFKDLTVTLVE
jgi:hypothetical protein